MSMQAEGTYTCMEAEGTITAHRFKGEVKLDAGKLKLVGDVSEETESYHGRFKKYEVNGSAVFIPLG